MLDRPLFARLAIFIFLYISLFILGANLERPLIICLISIRAPAKFIFARPVFVYC